MKVTFNNFYYKTNWNKLKAFSLKDMKNYYL